MRNVIEFAVVLIIGIVISITSYVAFGIEVEPLAFAIGYGLYSAIVADNRSRKLEEKLNKLDLYK